MSARLRQYFAQSTATMPRGPEGLVWCLALVASLGIVAVLPFLPLFAQSHGADPHFIGLMVGAYMAANLVCLYPAGWLSDRFGRRSMMAVGLVGFALASAGFLCFKDPTAFIVLRALEGVAGACFMPAALAYVADRAPVAMRGTRVAQLTVAENTGLLLGPAVGGALAVGFGLASPFVFLAIVCGLGGLMVARLPGGAPPIPPTDAEPAAPENWKDVHMGRLAGLLARSLAIGFSLGLYEAVWSIYLKDLGASHLDISWSWTLFAVPAVVLAPLAGQVLRRSGPAAPAVLGALFSAVVTVSYGLTHRVEVLLFLCLVEGIGFAFSYPAQNMLMIKVAPATMRGRVIGVVSAIKTLGALAGAILCPILYAMNPAWCFGVTALVLLVGAIGLAFSVIAYPDRDTEALPPRPAAAG